MINTYIKGLIVSSTPNSFEPELNLIEFCSMEKAFPIQLILSTGVIFLSISFIYLRHSSHKLSFIIFLSFIKFSGFINCNLRHFL